MFDFEKGCIRFIRGGKYPQSNSLLIDDDIRAIIDPACDEKKLRSIHDQAPIEIIINSHGHEDHILYNHLFPEAKLWVHALDAPVFKDMNAFINQFFHPDDIDEQTRTEWTQLLAEVVKFQPREPDRLLEDNQIIDFGNTRMQVLHTPGHTAGHLAFHFLEERVLFLADLDLVKFGPYYGDNTSSIDDTIASLQRLANIEADIYLVSHGKKGIMDANPVYIQNYINVVYQREDHLLEFLTSGPKTLNEITMHGIIYGGHRLSGGAWDLSKSERAMMKKHLGRLESLGRVRFEVGKYVLI